MPFWEGTIPVCVNDVDTAVASCVQEKRRCKGGTGKGKGKSEGGKAMFVLVLCFGTSRGPKGVKREMGNFGA